MEEKLYTMQLTKEQVELVINADKVKETLEEIKGEIEQYKEALKQSRNDWQRVFKTVGFEIPEDARYFDMEAFWKLLEQKCGKDGE